MPSLLTVSRISHSQGEEAREAAEAAARDASKTVKGAGHDTEEAFKGAGREMEGAAAVKGAAGQTDSDTAERIRRSGSKGTEGIDQAATDISHAASDNVQGAGQVFADAATFSEAIQQDVLDATVGLIVNASDKADAAVSDAGGTASDVAKAVDDAMKGKNS